MTPKNEHGLTQPQDVFALHLALGWSQMAAYRAAYPNAKASDKTITEKASRLAASPEVRARVAMLLKGSAAQVELTSAMVADEWRLIGYADARELSELRRNCCRYCWGAGHRYQRTAAEREAALEKWLAMPAKQKAKTGQLEFDEKGGIGFHKHREPNSDCPECFGDGVEEPFFKDTRHLSPAAARLFAGVKVTEKGIEVKARDQDAALENLGRVTGAFEKDNHQKADPLVSLLRDLAGNVFLPTPGAALPGAGAGADLQDEDDD